MSIELEETARTKPLRPEITETSRRLLEFARSTLGWKERHYLAAQEEAVRRHVLMEFPRIGRAPLRKEMMEALNLTVTELDMILGRLHALDLLCLDSGTGEILVTYPFSSRPTRHVVSFPDSAAAKPIFAQCAVDALGIPFMLCRAASIISSCPFCTRPLSLEVRDGAIVNHHPAEIVVWVPTCRMEHAATSICPTLNFFCSRIHALAWRQNHADEQGEVLKLGEAFYLGYGIFADLLTSSNGDHAVGGAAQPIEAPRNAIGTVSSAASVAAAFLASVCCIGPLLFTALGVGIGATGFLADTASFLKALLPYRPWFIGLTVLLLGMAFIVAYRSPKGSCPDGTNCDLPPGRRRQRLVLWMITAITIVLVLAPYWLGL
jgi:mercuric ion transport protein